jgi:hypothetical protein
LKGKLPWKKLQTNLLTYPLHLQLKSLILHLLIQRNKISRKYNKHELRLVKIPTITKAAAIAAMARYSGTGSVLGGSLCDRNSGREKERLSRSFVLRLQTPPRNAKKGGKISPAAKGIPCYSMPNIFFWSSHIKGIACLSCSMPISFSKVPAMIAWIISQGHTGLFFRNKYNHHTIICPSENSLKWF